MVQTVTYEHTNTYEILHPILPSTTSVWICFHGLGYLATYFKKYFEDLDPKHHAVILLQAPSKYYQGTNFKHVGASWLTKVDTVQETGNNFNYVDAVLENEKIVGDPRIVLFGYSQGVSMATRYLKYYNKPVQALIMHSGSIPHELTAQDGERFRSLSTRNIHIIGTKDEYVTPERSQIEKEKIELLFQDRCERYRPDIKHEVSSQLLVDISNTLA